nr:MAG TPA: hypothetical protein [Caudoviricetes sp.]
MVYGDNRVATSPSLGRGRPQTVQRRFTHREFLKGGLRWAELRKCLR